MPIVVLGLGKTGRSLAKHLSSRGEEVWGVDDKALDPSISWSHLCARTFSEGEIPPLDRVSRFFISPGVSPDHPLARRATDRGLTLEGELDLAFSLCRGTVVGITGTNGKSTTTALLGAMCQNQGWNTGIGGNLGTPFLDLVTSGEEFSHYVIEVSSFQLETCRQFRPRVAVLLNLSEDHYERHPDLSQYLAAKKRIFTQQGPEDFALYNADDLYCLQAVEGIRSKKIPFSTAKSVAGAYGREGEILWQPESPAREIFSLAHCRLHGLHNLENISATVAAAKALGIDKAAIQKTLDTFEGLPHRLQRVGKRGEVQFFDDSKATNVGAVVMSLASFDQDVVLIMGGVDKGGDYSPLKPLLKAKVKAVVVMGAAREKILKTLGDAAPFVEVNSMAEAVKRAWELAEGKGTVLLSPACSSFDMYRDYHERGMDFQKQVESIGT